MALEIFEGIVELAIDSAGSNNKKEQGCGCVILAVLILGVIGFVIYNITYSIDTEVIVDKKLSNNMIEYHQKNNASEIGKETLSPEIYDQVNINDTITINTIK